MLQLQERRSKTPKKRNFIGTIQGSVCEMKEILYVYPQKLKCFERHLNTVRWCSD